MALWHITNDQVKTNMFLIWAGPDAEDIDKYLHLSSSQQYNLDAVLKTFERYCKPICYFRTARLKFSSMKVIENWILMRHLIRYVMIWKEFYGYQIFLLYLSNTASTLVAQELRF